MKLAENSEKPDDSACTEPGACTRISGMKTAENQGLSDIWPRAGSRYERSLLPPRNWTAACAATQARNGADIGNAGRALLASINADGGRIGAERTSECETHDDGAEMSGEKDGGSASLFDCGGTINTEGDLGLSGEIAC